MSTSPSSPRRVRGWRICLAGWALLAGTIVTLAQGTNPGFTPYLDGLDALNEGRWSEAVAAFSRALERKPDDATFVLARGVAHVLAEQFEPALKDLERAPRLGLRGREALLWTYAAEAMSGIVIHPDHALGGGRNRGPQPVVVSIPGHVAQGGNDYTTEYGSFIVYRVGMEYQNFRLPVDLGGNGNPAGVKGAPMREALRKAGQLFAERWLKRPELAAANLARARQAFSGQDFGATLRDVERALAARPADPELRLKAGEAWLALGRPATARREFTIALTARTDLAAGYLGRARAAARLGDGRRAQADLEIAGKLDPAATKSARTAIEAESAKAKAGASLEAATAEFDRAVDAGAPLDRLIELARQLHLAAAPRRLRYDEYYQDRLRMLEEGTRAAPKNPDPWVRLSAFLLSEADNRGEVVEPRRELQWYRFQESPDKERLRALEAADRALAANPRHVAGLAQKALTLTALRRYAEAEKVAEQTLALGGNQPDALRLYGRFRAMRANQLSGEAFGLRQERTTSSTRTENRSDGVYEVTTTTTYPPTPADLNRASQLEAQAVQLRRQARAAMEAAVKVTRGTVEGALIEADLHQWDGKLDAAQAAFDRALKLDPKSIEAHDQLGLFLVRNGRADQADEHQAVARQLLHTTAAPLLRLAWRRLDRTAWDGARGYLNRARVLDPLDARARAMLGVSHDAENKPELAARAYRAALALEEARLRLDEPVVVTGKPLPRDALDFGLAIQAAFHLARGHERQSRPAEALALYRTALGYAGRMKPGFESRQMFTALWPDQKPARGAVVIQPDNAATLVAEAHLRAGKLLAASGRKDEAIAQYRSAARLGPLRLAGMPRIGNARGDSNFSGLAGAPAAEAQLLLARELVATGDARGAQQVLQDVGTNLPDHLRADLNQLHHTIAQLLSR
ncbi:MAG: tetratricopeptide repeat protein [Opitutaceae bacterium]|nr:tetratricopeptide repeat protein [Opitutaceae bacterium]